MSDIREALQSAMDGSRTETEETAPAPEAAESLSEPSSPSEDSNSPSNSEADAPTETAAQKAERLRDEAGRFAKKTGEAAKPAVKPTPKAQAAPTTTTGATPPPASTAGQTPPAPPSPPATAEAVKAPQSWKPAAREHFARLPPEVQQEVVRRERETAMALQQAAPHRQVAEAFQKTVEPYRALLTDEPMKVVGSLLQTAAQLQTAPPAHKAHLVATIVRQYGVDIAALDEALAGGQPAAAQGRAASAAVDPEAIAARVRQEVLQGFQQQRQVAEVQRAAKDVDAFAAEHEFFDDVRDTMADLTEVASRRGVVLSLKDAYTRAVQMHPEVAGVLQQREAAKAANATQASTQRARAASSSVASRPAVGPTAPAADDIGSALRAAMKAHAGR